MDIQINRKLLDGKMREWGDTTCRVASTSKDLPIQVILEVSVFEGNNKLDLDISELYMGKAIWNLNPGTVVHGHFTIPAKVDLVPFEYRAQLKWSIIDILDREHPILSISFVWNVPENDWWFDPEVLY